MNQKLAQELKMQIMHSVCQAASRNETIDPDSIPDLCEALFQWVNEKPQNG